MNSPEMQSWNWPAVRNCINLFYRPNLLIPKLSVKRISDIDWEKLKSEHDIKAVCFDKDNTLTSPYDDSLYPSIKESVEISKIVFMGQIAVLSNSIGSSQFDPDCTLAQKFTEGTGIPVIRHSSKKPDGAKEILKHFNKLSARQIAFVGDRLLTDVVLANEANFLSVYLTETLSLKRENIPSLIIRCIESNLLRFYTNLK